MVSVRRLAVLCAAAAAGAVLAADAAAFRTIIGPPRDDRTPIMTLAIIDPQEHMFGDTIRAWLQVIVQHRRVDPSTIKVEANFAPYTELEPVRVTSTSGPMRTRIVYEYLLGCVTRRCLPRAAGAVTLDQATITYKRRDSERPLEYTVEWPPIYITPRIGDERLGLGEPRWEVRDIPPPTYRVSPATVSRISGVLAAVFAAAAALLILRRLPVGRYAVRLGLRRDRRTALERALALVQETARAGNPEDGRRALERLAVELRRTRNPALAHTATRLAWSANDPLDGGVALLTDEVRRMVAANGR